MPACLKTEKEPMRKRISLLATAAAVAAATLAVAFPADATLAVPKHPGHVRIANHFDLAAGQMPENIALLPDGTANVTFAGSRQIAQIAPGGSTRILATLPATRRRRSQDSRPRIPPHHRHRPGSGRKHVRAVRDRHR